MPSLPPLPDVAAIIIVVFLAIGLHEFAHAKFADMAGDPTPRYYGRVTLNLTKHFELLGTLMMLFTAFTGFGIGWGRPVPMDPSKMKNPRWDHFMAVIAGPFANFMQAGVYGILYRLVVLFGPQLFEFRFLHAFLVYGVTLNLALCFFNLIPLGPLDGMWILGTFMRDKTRQAWTRFNLTSGQFVFLAIVLISQANPKLDLLSQFIGPPVMTLFRFMAGPPM